MPDVIEDNGDGDGHCLLGHEGGMVVWVVSDARAYCWPLEPGQTWDDFIAGTG